MAEFGISSIQHTRKNLIFACKPLNYQLFGVKITKMYVASSFWVNIVGLLLVFQLYPSRMLNQVDTYQSIRHSSLFTATVTGDVSIPAVNTRQRIFRGRAYRGRGSLSSAQSSREDNEQRNPYVNTIISAHPLSFDAEVLPLDESPRIKQQNATFIPHVTPVTIGSVVQFINNDPFFHNVFSLTPGARFNIGRRPTGDVYNKEIPRVSEVRITGLGEIHLFCDIHSGMNAVILSLDTPYFTRVEEDGSFTLGGLPAGRYELRAYHPQFDIITTEITVKENSTIQQNFNFSG